MVYLTEFLGRNNKNKINGFTLLELIIVSIIVSILAAISIPSFTKQVGKARETEIKNAVGTINRAQQAYHWEKGRFAQGDNDQHSLELLNLTINSVYVNSYNILGASNIAVTTPVNNNFELDQTKSYSGGVFVSAGTYDMIICQSLQPSASIPAPVSGDDCGVNNIVR